MTDITEAIRRLVNQYPGLEAGERIAFGRLGEEGGMAIMPGAGAAIEGERRSVTGRVWQLRRYPMTILARAGGLGEDGKAGCKERLDGLSRWLERLEAFPPLDGGMRLVGFAPEKPAYLQSQGDDRVETWAVELTARYEYRY